MKAMKIYISLPISGRDIESAEAQATYAAGIIEKTGHTPVNPFGIISPEETYASHMGADIAALLDCDAILMLDPWRSSRGCMLEHQAAKIYGKIIFAGIEDLEKKIKFCKYEVNQGAGD